MVYVDDILCIAHDTKPTMDSLGELYRLKEESLGIPDRYVGSNIKKYQLPDGREVWSMSSYDYVRNAVRNVDASLAASDKRLPTRYTD